MSSFLESTLMLIPKRCIGPFRLGMKLDEALKYLENAQEDNVDWDELLGFSDHGFKSYTNDWQGYLPGGGDHYVQLAFSKKTGALVQAAFAKGSDVLFYNVKLLKVTEHEACAVLKKYGGEPLETSPGCYNWVTLGVRTYNSDEPQSHPFESVSIYDYSFLTEIDADI